MRPVLEVDEVGQPVGPAADQPLKVVVEEVRAGGAAVDRGGGGGNQRILESNEPGPRASCLAGRP